MGGRRLSFTPRGTVYGPCLLQAQLRVVVISSWLGQDMITIILQRRGAVQITAQITMQNTTDEYSSQ